MARKSGLTKRQKQIIEMLTNFSEENPVTIQAISEQLKLSSRTVLREMPMIDAWFNTNDFRIVKKPKVGIYIDEDQEGKDLILELANMDGESQTLSKSERQDRILYELFVAEDVQKYFYFTSLFQISEGTLASDLDDVEQWLDHYNLKLERKPGVGIHLSGKEEDYRQAFIILLRRRMKEGNLECLVKYKDILPKSKKDQDQSDSLDEVIFIIKEMENALDIQYTEHSELHVALYLILTKQRIEHGFTIEDESIDLLSMMHLAECQVANWIGSKLGRTLGFPISEAEIYAIALQLLSAKIWKNNNDTKYNEESFRIRQMVMRISVNMEKLLDMNFLSDQVLIDGLCNHMKPAINRMKMDVYAENGQLDMVKDNYPEVFQAVVKACDFMKQELHVSDISEQELGFIAMYFSVSIEKAHNLARRVSVCVACPHGVGTSHMLAVNLQKEFPEIQVDLIISTAKVDELELSGMGIDLIIATCPLKIDYPHLQVDPSLNGSDKALIRKTLKETQASKPKKNIKHATQSKSMKKEDIEGLVALGGEVIQVLDNVKITSIESVDSKDEIIAKASEMYGRSPEDVERIEKDLMKREDVASTYLSQYEVMFFHCETKGIKHCRFGYLHINKSINIDGNHIKGAIVMLVPSSIHTSVYKDVMSEISGVLAQREDIIKAFYEKNRNAVVAQLEYSLGEYFQKAMER